MITMFTGSPGAGKTLSLVDFLSKLPGDRPLFVDGLNGLTLPHTAVDSNDWQNVLPDGAILVIDEAQRVWRPRGSGSKVPESVAALETHRHHGIDVYITTQAPALIDSNVRNLVGRHVHIRDTGVLGRYWYEWPEVSSNMNWKGCINKKRLSLPKKSFSLYKSSSMHTDPVRGVPRALIFGLVALVVLAFLVFGAVRIIQKNQTLPDPAISKTALAQTNTVSRETSSGLSQNTNAKSFIDDRIDFLPRVSNKPESAPAYDHLRAVHSMPNVVAGVCMDTVCTCFTNQGTDPGLSQSECRSFVSSPPFNPYVKKFSDQDQSSSKLAESSQQKSNL